MRAHGEWKGFLGGLCLENAKSIVLLHMGECGYGSSPLFSHGIDFPSSSEEIRQINQLKGAEISDCIPHMT